MKKLTLLLSLALALVSCGADDPPVDSTPDQGMDNLNNLNNSNNSNNENNSFEPDVSEPGNNVVEDMRTMPDMTSPADDMGADSSANLDAGMMADMQGLCDENGFTTTSSFAEAPTSGDSFFYVGYQGDEANPPFDQLSFEIYNEFGGVVTTQSFTFTGESYADCGLCLLIFRCSTQEDCDTFMPQSGDVTITSIGTNEGDTFTADFTNVELAEVDVDFETFATSLIAGGDSWCINSLSVNEMVTTFEDP